MTGAPPSGSGCQPTASAADASSQSGIPSAWDCEQLLARVEHALNARENARQLVRVRAGEFDAAQSAVHDFGRATESLAYIFERLDGLIVLRAIVAQGIEAATADETGTGSAVGESPVGNADAPETQDLSTPLPSGSIER